MKRVLTTLMLLFPIILFGYGATDWIKVTHKDGRFIILFPNEPNEIVKDVATPMGNIKLTFVVYDSVTRTDSNALYGVGYADYPEDLVNSDFEQELTNDFFERTIAGSAEAVNGKVLKTLPVVYRNYPGRIVKMSFLDGHGIMNARYYLVKNRLYILEVGCENKYDNNIACQRFFESFSLRGNP